MQRPRRVSSFPRPSVLALTAAALGIGLLPATASRGHAACGGDQEPPAPEAAESVRSAPPDTTPYTRPVLPEDLSPGGRPALPEHGTTGPDASGDHDSLAPPRTDDERDEEPER